MPEEIESGCAFSEMGERTLFGIQVHLSYTPLKLRTYLGNDHPHVCNPTDLYATLDIPTCKTAA